MNPKYFGRLREAAVNDVLGVAKVQTCFEVLLGEKPKVVQSMYFEGNSATWEHQDTYYLDAEKLGDMSAAWVALEDISAKAGRFFICPGSHKIELEKQNKRNQYCRQSFCLYRKDSRHNERSKHGNKGPFA